MKKFKRLTRYLRDSLAYWQVLSRPESAYMYKVSRVEDGSPDLLPAKRLHAGVYLAKGFVSEHDIKDDMLHVESDPHQTHADYFVVKRRDEVVAVARQIIYKGEGDHHESFPVLEKAIIYERSRARILGFHPKEIVEISALVKKSSESSIVPLILYRELWRHSQGKHRLWVMACDVRLYERLKLLFGPTFTKIGQRTPYKGGDVIPVALSTREAQKYLEKITRTRSSTRIEGIKKRAAKFMLKGNS